MQSHRVRHAMREAENLPSTLCGTSNEGQIPLNLVVRRLRRVSIAA
jgi:hypothetical protein